MSKIVDYSLDHPQEKFSGADKPKKNPFKVNSEYIKFSKECLGTNIARWREEDIIHNSDPLN